MNASNLFSLIPIQSIRLLAMMREPKSTVQRHLESWKILRQSTPSFFHHPPDVHCTKVVLRVGTSRANEHSEGSHVIFVIFVNQPLALVLARHCFARDSPTLILWNPLVLGGGAFPSFQVDPFFISHFLQIFALFQPSCLVGNYFDFF
jgi:hypothetical protein